MFPKKSCVVTLLYMIIYEKHIMFSICIWGNAWIFGIEKEKYLWIHLIVDFMDLWYYLEILKMFCLKLYYLGNWYKIFLTRNGFKDFENIVNIWLLKYLMKLLGSKLYILNTFNLWAFDVVLSLCYDIGDYPLFVTCD